MEIEIFEFSRQKWSLKNTIRKKCCFLMKHFFRIFKHSAVADMMLRSKQEKKRHQTVRKIPLQFNCFRNKDHVLIL